MEKIVLMEKEVKCTYLLLFQLRLPNRLLLLLILNSKVWAISKQEGAYYIISLAKSIKLLKQPINSSLYPQEFQNYVLYVGTNEI